MYHGPKEASSFGGKLYTNIINSIALEIYETKVLVVYTCIVMGMTSHHYSDSRQVSGTKSVLVRYGL